jgi:hypothetical protein
MPGVPRANYMPFPFQIVQSQNVVLIAYEVAEANRILYVDQPDLESQVDAWMGHSNAHWEGDTLVVETANFNGKNPIRGSTENMRVTERFTRVDDETIIYRFTIDDEIMWTRPWSAELSMKKTIGPLFEHACHEGNYGLYNTLVGARREERLAAEAAAAQE